MTEIELSKEEIETLKKQGADAFAKSVFHARNPFYKAENMPSRTGEDVKIWRAKVDAWESGYTMAKLNKKS
jgi:hypothetical protein